MWKRKNADQRVKRSFKTADEVLKVGAVERESGGMWRIGGIPACWQHRRRRPSAWLQSRTPLPGFMCGLLDVLTATCLPASPQYMAGHCWLHVLTGISDAACLQESEEKPAVIERQTIIDMRGPQVCACVCVCV